MTGDGGRFKRHGASTDPRSGHSRAEADSSGFGSRMLQQISFVLAVVIGVFGLIALVALATGNTSPYGIGGAIALGALLLYMAFRYVQRRTRRRSTGDVFTKDL